MTEKIQRHTRFWSGEGPSLILVGGGDTTVYDTDHYDLRFADPRLMWQTEVRRARAAADWPTDGIPTVRPNLGVVFLPAVAGQGYEVKPDQMPWPGQPLTADRIREARGVDVAAAEVMRKAQEFYRIHAASGEVEVAAYHPDTQGVFDVAHLLWGDRIFLAMAGEQDEQAWVLELMEICLDLYVRVTRRVKELLGEEPGTMIHGHGTGQGVYFPHAGVRISEDTPTLLSPQMIEHFVMPFIERSIEPFGGGFAHFCGGHRSFFELLCRLPLVRAIDLGNPEMYDLSWLLGRCAESATVLYSRLPAEEGESCQAYVRRIGRAVKAAGARCILRATCEPRDREEAQAMVASWREMTGC